MDQPDLYLNWWGARPNVGDAMSLYLAQKLTSRPVKHSSAAPLGSEIHFGIGSILLSSDANSIVWGTGYMMEIRHEASRPKKPFEIHAVRGPLTRGELLKYNVPCPRVYGDPGLLIPRFYKPKVNVKYKLGVVPHFMDEDHLWLQHREDDDLLVLNVADPVELFVDKLNSCECIASSSLHGIITADAYRIPNLWIEFSNKVGGHGFKFCDYFSSIGEDFPKPFAIQDSTTISDVIQKMKLREIKLNLDKLLGACPYE